MITLRKATKSDIPTLEYWDRQPHVIAAHTDGGEYDSDDWTWEQDLAMNPLYYQTYIAFLDTQPLGVIQICDPANEESHYWGEMEQNQRAIDIWIGELTNTGKGYGTIMMREAIELCFSDPKVTTIWVDPLASNERAIKFYQQIGFVFVQYRHFNDDYCAVLKLNRVGYNLIKNN
ncbi:GNAT family N-acetyltransferase [Calothrix sp. HK-06]|nr:GNAT family N-acetyltransferase [Calothrix sp. HK-06]